MKKEHEITSKEEILEILHTALICRVAFHDDPFPYVLAFNFGFSNGCIYIHSAKEGKKTDLIRKDNRVGFEVDINTEIVKSGKPCGWTTRYRSVTGVGFADILEDSEDKKEGLDIIMRQHEGGSKYEYDLNSLDRMLIIRIRILDMKAKRSGN